MAATMMGSSSLASSNFFGSNVRQQAGVSGRRVAPVSLTVWAGWGKQPKIGPGKRWEHPELTANGKVVRTKMHVKTGDTVIIIAGKDKGTVAEIEKVDTQYGLVTVKGVNIKVKNTKPKSENDQGTQVRKEFPVHHSNVMHYSKTANVRSRVGHKIDEATGKKVRVLVKTGEVLP